MKGLTPRVVRIVFLILGLIGVAAIGIGLSGGWNGVCVAGGVICVAAVVFDFAMYRCAHCRAYLGRNSPKGYCPRCGEKIEEMERVG